MTFQRVISFILTFFAIFLTACQPPILYHQTQSNVADANQRLNEARQKSDDAAKTPPSMVVNQGLYVDRTPINLSKRPMWVKNRIVLRGDQLPFSYYSRAAVNGTRHNILTRYQVGLDQAQTMTMNYSGPIEGALDLIASKTGYVYTINGNEVYWQAFVTKTFDISFMPGSSDYMMGKGTGASTSSGGAGGSGQSSTAFYDDSASAQYSNLKGTLSVWKDLENTIKQLLSPDGKVIVSESTTSVTVRDRPTNVDLVAKFIYNLNSNLSKQVLVKVQIVEVELSSDFLNGINWDIVQQAFGHSNYILNANFGTPISITPFGGNAVPKIGLQKAADLAATASWFQALINALKQQGKVSVVTEPRVVCLNNQVSVIRIVNQQGYVASVQNTTVAGAATGGSGGTVTSQVTPGSLITGLTLYILPKIMNGKVYLQVNADLANKIGSGLTTFSTGGTDSVTIQLPNLTQKQFSQKSLIGSGDAMILSGFRRVENESEAMQLFDSQALGGMGARQAVTETIVLITPIILPGIA